MLRRLLTAAVLLAGLAPGVIAQPAPAMNVVPAPGVPGGTVKLPPRDQLRAGPGTKTARLPHAIRAMMAAQTLNVPASWDWTKGNTVLLPIMGNNQYGNCYYVTLQKLFMLYSANVKNVPLVFDQQAAIKRYLKLSGGDNGLSDSDVFPELRGGVIGPKGPHKALDVLIVPANDKAARDLTQWAFGPQMFTFTVYENFTNGARPGAHFTGSSGRAVGGHAIPFSGKRANGDEQAETWGMQPSITVTEDWIRSVDPEFIAVFSLEWFDDKGFAPNGEHYQTLAPLWNSIGGKVDPVGPFPPPAKPVPTAKLGAKPEAIAAGGSAVLTWETTNATLVTLNGAPVAASGTMTVTPAATSTYTLTAAAGNAVPATASATVTVGAPAPVGGTDVVILGGDKFTFDRATKTVELADGWKAAGGSAGDVLAAMTAKGINPAVIADVLQLIAHLSAKPIDPAAVLADLLKIWADVQKQAVAPQFTPAPAVPMARLAPAPHVSAPFPARRPVLFPNRPVRRLLSRAADGFHLCP